MVPRGFHCVVPRPLPRPNIYGKREIDMKCKIKMTDKLLPVGGSADRKGETGTCPECLTPGVLLSIVGGFVRAHTVSSVAIPENNPQPATVIPERRAHKHASKSGKITTGLSEPQVDLVDTGARIGDPRAAECRRTAEIEGAAGIGTVKVPRKVPTGTKLKSGAPRMGTKMIDVPATEEHVREALDYWRNRTCKTDGMRKTQNESVTLLSRRLEAIMSAQVVAYDAELRTVKVVAVAPVADQPALSASVDAASVQRGPTLVRGTAETFQRPVDMVWTEHAKKRSRGTMEAPLGRERFDRTITDVPEPRPKLTASQRRRYRRTTLAALGQSRKGK